MLPSIECICVARKMCSSLLVLNKNKRCKLVPFRCYFKRNVDKEKPIQQSSEESKLPPLTGIDDENFGEYLKRSMFDAKAYKEGFKLLLSHAHQFYKERVEEIRESPRVDSKVNRVDVIHKFETQEDVEKFTVHTDSSFNMGYSSASFNLTENETAVFSGYIDTTIPKTGSISFSGYANISGPKQRKAFNRYVPYNWTQYTHLVLKIRGDGRTYMVVLSTPFTVTELQYTQYNHQLYTRGGPYWQIVKIPFSYFIAVKKGRLYGYQYGMTPLHMILNLGITVAGYEGPFKLEIDYIGLEYMEGQKKTSPYEIYERQ